MKRIRITDQSLESFDVCFWSGHRGKQASSSGVRCSRGNETTSASTTWSRADCIQPRGLFQHRRSEELACSGVTAKNSQVWATWIWTILPAARASRIRPNDCRLEPLVCVTSFVVQRTALLEPCGRPEVAARTSMCIDPSSTTHGNGHDGQVFGWRIYFKCLGLGRRLRAREPRHKRSTRFRHDNDDDFQTRSPILGARKETLRSFAISCAATLCFLSEAQRPEDSKPE